MTENPHAVGGSARAADDYLANIVEGRCSDAESVLRMVVEARAALRAEERERVLGALPGAFNTATADDKIRYPEGISDRELVLLERVARYRYALTEVDICLRWIADHYPKVIREMPTELHRRLESVRVDYDE